MEKVRNISKNNSKINRRLGNARDEGHGLERLSWVLPYLDQGSRRHTGAFKVKSLSHTPKFSAPYTNVIAW